MAERRRSRHPQSLDQGDPGGASEAALESPLVRAGHQVVATHLGAGATVPTLELKQTGSGSPLGCPCLSTTRDSAGAAGPVSKIGPAVQHTAGARRQRRGRRRTRRGARHRGHRRGVRPAAIGPFRSGFRSLSVFKLERDGLIERQRHETDWAGRDLGTAMRPLVEWARKKAPDELAEIYPEGQMVGRTRNSGGASCPVSRHRPHSSTWAVLISPGRSEGSCTRASGSRRGDQDTRSGRWT